jgi:hypothetical protein
MTQPRGAHLRQCVADAERARKPLNLRAAVVAANGGQTVVLHPGFLLNRQHH